MNGATQSTEFNVKPKSEQAMVELGGRVAVAINKVDSPLLILLNGDLGAGKTTISRGILQGLGHSGAVKSPTYTLVEPYDLDIGKVFHFDLYRVMDPEELEHIGFTDYLSEGKLCMIEWPDNGGSNIPKPDIVIDISALECGRHVAIEGLSELGKQCMSQL